MFVAPESAPGNLHERLTAIAQAGFDRAERKFDIMQQLGTNRALNDNSFHTRRRKRHSDSRRNVPDERSYCAPHRSHTMELGALLSQ